MRLSEVSLDRPVSTVVLLVSLIVIGAVAIFDLPLDFMPLVKEPEVDVEVPFPGSHPLEALRQVILPIEEEVATIPDVKSIRSHAASGMARTEVEFDWSADIDLKKTEVREAVERARPRLPAGVGHIRVQGDVGGPGEGGAILHGRISAERDLSESWELLDRRIGRPLERIKGVARVSLYGVEPQQVRVDLDLDAFRRHGVGPGDLLSRIDGANLDLDLGAVRGDVVRYDVRAVGRFRDLEAIRNLLLGPHGLRVRDVARVSLEEPRLDYGRHLDRKFAIGIDVFKEPSANTVDTVDRVMARIREIERDPELAGIRLLVWLNQGEEIRSSLRGLRNSGLFGGVLAAVVLYLFLRRLSTTLIVSTAIPFSLVATCGAMYLLGSEFNVLTLLGLMFGVGMLVDNAIVVIENIHRLEQRGLVPPRAAREGSSQVALAVVASTATTVIVWSWLFVMPRSHLTIYMGQVALTMCLAVGCSLLISLTFIPLAAARFVPARPVRPGFLLARIVPAYRAMLGWTLRHRFLTLLGMLLLGSSAAVPIGLIEKSGEPKLQQREASIFYQVHDPATKDVLEGYVDQVEGWLESRREELGYESLYSWYSETEGCMTRVYLPREKATEDAIARLRRQLQDDLPVIPGVKLEVGDREWWRHGAEGRRMVSVALHGEDPEYLERLAARVEERLRGVPDVVEIYGPTVQGQKEVRVVVDPERARAAGLTPGAVAEAVAFAFRGQRLRRFEARDGELEIVVGLPDEARPGLASLAGLAIPAPRGGTLPLESVAAIAVGRTAPMLRREDRRTTTWVSVQFDEKELTTDEAQARVAERMEGLVLPAGYSWDWGQWGRERDEALGVMLQGVLLSLLVVILLMAALFESLSQPLAIIITLPLAFFGAFWSLWIFGYDLDAVGFMGVIILIGIVVNNGIVMVDHVNHLRRQGLGRTPALVEGCGDRLRPVLMTATTTVFGLLPLAFSGSTVAGAYIDSMAVGVLGGLCTSTLFTLVALPVWYTTVEDLGALGSRLMPRRGEVPA
jgi:HAE1 family hydrophobic/amphiphilic exporter-1